MPNFGDWVYSVDRDATIAAYRAAEEGGAQGCECIWCRNFVVARRLVFPKRFLALLDGLGIDPLKDAEASHAGREAPGQHFYSGWFHFIGTYEWAATFPPVDLGSGFTAGLGPASSPRLLAFEKLQVLELGFSARSVPWLLPEPELD